MLQHWISAPEMLQSGRDKGKSKAAQSLSQLSACTQTLTQTPLLHTTAVPGLQDSALQSLDVGLATHLITHRSSTNLLLPHSINSPATSCQKPRLVTGCWQGKCFPKNSGILHWAWNWDSSDLTSTIKSSLKFNGQSIINPTQTFSASKPGYQQDRNSFAARQPRTILSIFCREHMPWIVSTHDLLQHLDEKTLGQERRYSSNQYLHAKLGRVKKWGIRQTNPELQCGSRALILLGAKQNFPSKAQRGLTWVKSTSYTTLNISSSLNHCLVTKCGSKQAAGDRGSVFPQLSFFSHILRSLPL